MDIRTVSEITRYIKTIINNAKILSSVFIQGEISNYKCYPSGHAYFTLKDRDASLKCVFFRVKDKKLDFIPKDGMQVIASGNISVYERDGVYQLYVNSLIPTGRGERAEALQKLKKRLEEEGLFNIQHKKPLPQYPRTIGVITSLAGAVLHDIKKVSYGRAPFTRLVLYPVRVQGEGAAEEIKEALHFFNTKYPVDVLIVGRGGGSVEDLWAFNEEIVVRAIFASRIPVISCVGHETDVTLADFVADVRAATPSQAAEFATVDVLELEKTIFSLKERMNLSKNRVLKLKRLKLKNLQDKISGHSLKKVILERYQRLDFLRARFEKSITTSLQQKKENLTLALHRLELLNPLHVIRRGYGILERAKDKRLVKSIRDIDLYDEMRVILKDGTLFAKVIEKEHEQ